MYNQLVSILLAMHTRIEVHCMEKTYCEIPDEVKRIIRQFYNWEKYYGKVSSQRYVSFNELDKTISRTEETVEYALDVDFENLSKEKKNPGNEKSTPQPLRR